jgi:hypothetical protein
MAENFEEAGKKIFDFAQAGQGCSMLDEVRQLSYTDITNAFKVAQMLEDNRIQKMSEPQFPLVAFKHGDDNSNGRAAVDVELLDPSRNRLCSNIFHYDNAALGTENTYCFDLKAKK